jgi:hypothetical protein
VRASQDYSVRKAGGFSPELAGTATSGGETLIECELESPNGPDIPKIPMKWVNQ